MFPVRDDNGIARWVVSKELLLPVGRKSGQCAARRRRQCRGVRFLHVLVSATQPKPKALQRVNWRRFEWLKKHAAFKSFIVLEIEIARIARIANAIENSCGITRHATKQISMQFETDITVGH